MEFNLKKLECFLCNENICIIFVRMNDENFYKVLNNPKLISDRIFIDSCLNNHGNNIHILRAFGKWNGVKGIVKDLIREYSPETITHYTNDLRLKFLYKRRVLCHS